MKLAVALFQNQVSPRFDFAPAFLVVQMEGGAVVTREVLPSAEWGPRHRIRVLMDLGTEALICGAIDRESREQLIAGGIQVYSWVTGGVEEALGCFLNGELDSGMVLGPDGHCCERWRFSRGQTGPGAKRGCRGGRDALQDELGPRRRQGRPRRGARVKNPERR